MQEDNTNYAKDARQALVEAADTICELNNINTKIMGANTLLYKKLKGTTKACIRMTQAAIYYDATYSRLSPELQKEIDRIGKQVIIDYDLTEFM